MSQTSDAPSSKEFDPFSQESLDIVATVEALPDTLAFEHVMYANRLERVAIYRMIDPIQLRFMNGKFPDELRDMMPIGRGGRPTAISELVARLTEPSASSESFIDMSFVVDGIRHNLHATEQKTEYTVVRDDPCHYELSGDVANKLLAALVYARQYDPDQAEQQPMQFEASRIHTPRTAMCDFAESAILTLGDFDGDARVTTMSMFSTDTDTVVARLSEIETPRLSGLQSRLQLVSLDDFLSGQETIVEQNKTITPRATDRLRYAKILSGENEVFVDPEADFAEWSKICRKFIKIIETPLKSFSYLDEPDLG